MDGSEGKLATCCIRPAAIYGEGEERHLPRILEMVQQGLAFFAIGPDLYFPSCYRRLQYPFCPY